MASASAPSRTRGSTRARRRAYASPRSQDVGFWNPAQGVNRITHPVGGYPRLTPGPLSPMFEKKEPWGNQGSFRSKRKSGIALARAICASVGAAVTAAEERPKPIVQTNFKHLNLAARRESVPPERPRSKREVIQFDKVILKLR